MRTDGTFSNKEQFVLDSGLKFCQSVIVPSYNGRERALIKSVAGFINELENMGYVPSPELIKVLKNLSPEELEALHTHVVTNLKTATGADKKYIPLFVNFPEDVPNDTEYLLRRFVNIVGQHFFDLFDETNSTTLSCGCRVSNEMFELLDFNACPVCQFQVDELGSENSDDGSTVSALPSKVLYLGTEKDLETLFTNLMGSKTSVTPDSKEFMKNYMDNFEFTSKLPDTVHMKEHLAILGGKVAASNRSDEAIKILRNYFNTSTDILRLACVFSDGDETLTTQTRFKLTRSQRKIILGLLNDIDDPLQDMKRYRERWLRLGETLHPNEYRERYSHAYNVFDVIRNEPESIITFNSTLEALFENGEYETAAKLLCDRPGDFARRLDQILRNLPSKKEQEKVAKEFVKVAPQVSTSVLLVLRYHMRNRYEKAEYRYFIPKGNVGKIKYFTEDSRNAIGLRALNVLAKGIDEVLEERFCDYGSLGDVYVDPSIKDIIVPLKQRSAGSSLITLERGTRLDLSSKTNVVRLFQYWKDVDDETLGNDRARIYENRVDLDLSAVIFNEDFEQIAHVAYTNLQEEGIVHSGDIQSAPKGASEFIDVDIEKVKEAFKGAKYIGVVTTSYNGQLFDNFESFAGFMELEGAGKKHFDPHAVRNKFEINGPNTTSYSMVLDLEERQVIWLNFVAGARAFHNMVEGTTCMRNEIMTRIAIDSIEHMPNMHYLVSLHLKNRAKSVDEEFDKNKEYDTIIDKDFVMQLEEIQANWL